jgi:hypothetical protein
MPAVNYNIDHNNLINRVLSCFVSSLVFAYKSLKFTGIKNFRTGLINRLEKKIIKVDLMSEGLVSKVSKYSQLEAKKKHDGIAQVLRDYIKMYSLLTSANFFDNTQLREICSNTLNNFYEADAILKQKAFSDSQPNLEDKQLLEFASHMSITRI